MKKIFVLTILLILPLALFAQWFGDGLSVTTAYYGTINASNTMQAWNTTNYPGGIIYVGRSGAGQNDLEITSGGSLLINSGITVKFCTTATDLRITGTGTLNAIGSASQPILFTKNAQATWGHITFEGSTGVSNIQYSTIEFGFKTGTGLDGYGGGLHANTSNLTISDCTFQNNTSLYGGGIFVNKNQNPSISNSIFKNNSAAYGGGALYFWNTTSSVVTNCLIFRNTVTGSGYGGGGIFIGPSSSNVKIINCVIASNSAPLSNGSEIYLYTSGSAAIINSIIWGTANPLYFFSTPTTVMQYCGINGIAYPTCVNLNSVNSQPDGPNFIDPTTDNYNIKLLSPCRDAGTSTNAPTTDYLGNGRIGNYDIGAYEVQYIRWNGSTSNIWGTPSNWDSNIDPASGFFDIIIPSGLTNYPTDPSTGYVIGLNKTMILYPGAKATFASLRNNGSLILQSDATGISSLILNTNVTATVDLFLTGGNPGAPLLKLNKWHFISSPVNSLPISVFAPVTKNVVMWYDNMVSGTLATGWIAYNGYRYSTGVMDGPTFSSLVTGIGYDYYGAADQKYTFTGTLNYSDISVPLSFAVNDALHGFNLVGNPFPSGLNWDDIVNGVYYPYPASTSKFLYFTRDNAQCSYIGGVGIPADVTGIIPPMQGFFVKTTAAGNLTIPAAARTQGAIHSRYKSMEVIPLVRLSLSESSISDETVVRFDATANSGLDNDFDAPKMFLSSDLLSIYSSLNGNNYAINGLPFPETFVEIPIAVNLLTAGNHTITATQLQGLENYDVTLKDKTTGFETKLKDNPVLYFAGLPGTAADRFVLKVGTITTGVDNPVFSESTFNIYPANNQINIQTISNLWEGKSGSVKVMDLTGKVVGALDYCEFSKNSLTQVAAPFTRGIYIVEIKSGLLRHVGKVIIK